MNDKMKILTNIMNRIVGVNLLPIKNTARLFSGKADCSQQIYKHFLKIEQTTNLDLFPCDIKKVTTKKNPSLYVADQQIADQIATSISRFRKKNVPFFEINPGPCILTTSLLNQLKPRKIGLIERNDEFTNVQQRLIQEHRSKIFQKTIKPVGAYPSTTAKFILEHCEKRLWHEDIIYQLFFILQSEDIYRLINDVIKQSRLFSNGRAEIFAVMPSFELMKLTAGPDSKYWLYTHKSCIFQILFDYDVLAEIPKEGFLPWWNAKRAFGGKIEYDSDLFQLVRIVPKPDLFSVFQPADLPLLKFFLIQCLFKRKGFIIPKLEGWIPGIGVELITSPLDEQLSTEQQNESKNAIWRDLSKSLNVFTESGSLTPLEICALFKFFQKSPHFKTSCFHQQCQEFYASKPMKSLSDSALSDNDDVPNTFFAPV